MNTTPPHQDAGKDQAAAVAALKTMTSNQMSVLAGLGATDTTVQLTHEIVHGALMLAVEVTIAQKAKRR